MSKTDGRRVNALNCLSQLKAYSLAYSAHFLHPSNALTLESNGASDESTDDANNESAEVSLDVRASYPHRLQIPDEVPDRDVAVQQNIVMELVEKKNQYLSEVNKVSANYHRAKAASRGKSKSPVHTSHLNRLLELTQSDPDPYFFGAYNWNYTGGLLQSMTDNDLVFYVTGEKLNTLNTATLTVSNDRLQMRHLDSTTDHVDGTIFEVIKSPHNSYVATRQRSKLTIYALGSDNVQDNITYTDRIPYVGGTFVGDHFYSMNMKRTVERYDLETQRNTGRIHLRKAKNNSFWCRLQTYNQQIVYADESRIKVYDSRLFGTKQAKCMELRVDSITEKCEEITTIYSHMDEHNLYVGLTHNLCVIDVRYGTEGSNKLTRYTHQMKTPPFAIDAIGGGIAGTTMNERVICAAGMHAADVMLLQHSKNQGDKVQVNNMPQRIFSPADVDCAMRQNGLQPARAPLNRRINVGACFVRVRSQLFLLSEKASGELYYQEITHESEERPNIEKQCLHPVDQQPEANEDIVATTVTNFDSMKRILTYKLPDDGDQPEFDNPKPNRWQKSYDQLASYKDMLSADLLSVWSERLQPASANNKAEKTELVNRWINKASGFDALGGDNYSE